MTHGAFDTDLPLRRGGRCVMACGPLGWKEIPPGSNELGLPYDDAARSRIEVQIAQPVTELPEFPEVVGVGESRFRRGTPEWATVVVLAGNQTFQPGDAKATAHATIERTSGDSFFDSWEARVTLV